MKLKKKHQTIFDLRVRMLFAFSFLLFLFTFLVIKPFNDKQQVGNFSLQNEIALLESENNTLRK